MGVESWEVMWEKRSGQWLEELRHLNVLITPFLHLDLGAALTQHCVLCVPAATQGRQAPVALPGPEVSPAQGPPLLIPDPSRRPSPSGPEGPTEVRWAG